MVFSRFRSSGSLIKKPCPPPRRAVTLGLIIHSAMYGPQAAFFSKLFGTRVRYSGAPSLGYQLASPLAGGLAPLIATALARTEGQTLAGGALPHRHGRDHDRGGVEGGERTANPSKKAGPQNLFSTSRMAVM